jgi:hypothetical protein
VIDKIRKNNNNISEILILETTFKLMNLIHLEIRSSNNYWNPTITLNAIRAIPGVVNVHPSADFEILNNDNTTNTTITNVLSALGLDQNASCYRGTGVRIAVLDTGIDYTHVAMDGTGTTAAYQAAYGFDISDAANTQRDGYFPTDKVVDGYDYLGDVYADRQSALSADPDDDPIDLAGHGTAVAHAIRTVAPEVSLIAVKTCTTFGTTCPDFAILKGLEYILDPNNDGNTEDAADIVNLSLGRMYTSSYYSVLSRAIENTIANGVLAVTAVGNSGNRPYIVGGDSSTRNAITVGATEQSTDGTSAVIAKYSSRGPEEFNAAKPDLVAPGGPFNLAFASTGNQYRPFQGTSFAAPLVAGAAALLKEKCPECSPFAIKAMLMNHANHQILYHDDGDTQLAPVTLQGSGRIHIQKALSASFWAYSLEDVQPAMSMGVINAAQDITISRTLRITPTPTGVTSAETLQMGYVFRNTDIDSTAVQIKITPETLDISSSMGDMNNCDVGQYYDVQVQFIIDASKAPPNRMYSGGSVGNDPSGLDFNEIDGWITVDSTSSLSASVPFHMILRAAADVQIAHSTFVDAALNTNLLPAEYDVGLQNLGAGVAQIDAFQLLFVSSDDPENAYGVSDPPSDLRYVGYRTVPVDVQGCTYLVEFAITTWESQRMLALTHFEILIDTNGDQVAEYTVYNAGLQIGNPPTKRSEMRIIDRASMTEYCVGFCPDHATNTANTVLRFCSEDIGIQDRTNVSLNIKIVSYSFPDDSTSDSSVEWMTITVPDSGLSAPSYDIVPGGILPTMTISGTGTMADGSRPLGLLLHTNAYRSPESTGAAIIASEALVIVRSGSTIPTELSPDDLEFPKLQNIAGPSCSWAQKHQQERQQCSSSNRLRRSLGANQSPLFGNRSSSSAVPSVSSVFTKFGYRKTSEFNLAMTTSTTRALQGQTEEMCPEYVIPRLTPIVVSEVSADDPDNVATVNNNQNDNPANPAVSTASPITTSDNADGVTAPSYPPVSPLPITEHDDIPQHDATSASRRAHALGSSITMWTVMAISSIAVIFLKL